VATKNEELASGCFSRAMPDEPMFVLLARDPSAPSLVESWAHRRATEIGQGNRPESDKAQVGEAYALASKMRAWRANNDGTWRKGTTLFPELEDKT